MEEVVAEAETEHNPYHMLERAVGVAAICMRRLIECRLVTDRFQGAVRGARGASPGGCRMARDLPERHRRCDLQDYDLRTRKTERRTPKAIADKMLHARVIGVLSSSAYLPDGLLIASDTQRKIGLFHFTAAEIAAIFDAFLTDRVRLSTHGYADVDVHGPTRVVARRE